MTGCLFCFQFTVIENQSYYYHSGKNLLWDIYFYFFGVNNLGLMEKREGNSQTVGEGKPKGVAVQQNQGPTNPD